MKFASPETSEIAISAPAAIAGVRLSIGPVKLRRTPIFTSSAEAAPAIRVAAAVVSKSFFMVPPVGFADPFAGPSRISAMSRVRGAFVNDNRTGPGLFPAVRRGFRGVA